MDVWNRVEQFCDRFGLRVPILQAPMSGACPPALAIAVAGAGAMGGAGAVQDSPEHVLHSATNMHRTPAAFTAPARSLSSLRAEHQWAAVDLLKISAEGAEFSILDAVLTAAEPVSAICVEFAQPVAVATVHAAVEQLHRAGYTAVARSA